MIDQERIQADIARFEGEGGAVTAPFYSLGKGMGMDSTLPRICKHCKHWEKSEPEGAPSLCKKLSNSRTYPILSYGDTFTYGSYGCNLWEAKDGKTS